MINPASMLTDIFGPPGLLQAGLRAPETASGLARAVENTSSPGISLADARSFSSQLIVEQYSIRITARIQAPAPDFGSVTSLDFSVEATAQRIFDFSISLFAVYQEQNADESFESALAGFEQLVRDAIDEGFGEARDILDELGRLDEQVAEFVDETHSVLQVLLDEFFKEATEDDFAGILPADTSLDSYWATIEFEYQYLHIESLSVSGTSAEDSASFSAEFSRLHYESLSIALSYGESAPESTIEMIA